MDQLFSPGSELALALLRRRASEGTCSPTDKQPQQKTKAHER